LVSRAPRLRQRAFTLIEMLVLIIIMAVLSSVVVPAYSRLRDQSAFDAHIGDLVGFLAQMRSLAVEQGCDVELTFDAQSESFRARAETGDLSGDLPTVMAGTLEATPTALERTFTFPEDFAVADFQVFGPEVYLNAAASAQQATIRFHEDGTSDGMRFVVQRATGQSATITVWPSTGLAEVESGNVSSAEYARSWTR
jgi:prepilin-type N-terminal cleavage/methylation domain-containing protein